MVRTLAPCAVLLLALTGCNLTSNRSVVSPLTGRSLTVSTVNPSSGVTLGISPADQGGSGDGAAPLTRSYPQGTAVILTAPAAAGSNLFQGWSGCRSTSGTTCTVVMDSDTAVSATYAPLVYTLTVNAANTSAGVAVAVSPADNNGAKDGTTSFTRRFNAGTAVTLTAPASSNFSNFASWTGCAQAVGATCTVAVNSNTSVTANYSTPASATLTISSANPTSGVAFTVAPGDLSGAANGTSGTVRTYPLGTRVSITAPATYSGNTFSTWSGCASVSGSTCTVTVNANTYVLAAYVTPAQGTTYYVSPSGSDGNTGTSISSAFLTVQKAANLTNPGDIVYVMNGTYTNPGGTILKVNRSGTAAAPIAFRAYPGQAPVLSFNSFVGIGFATTASYIEISGFTVLGNNDNVTLTQAQQYENDPANHPELNGNCIFIDGRQGTDTQRPHHISILNNTVGKCGGAGIAANGVDYITIAGNTVFNSAWYNAYGCSAISVNSSWNSDSSTGYKFVITGNRLYGNQSFIPWKAAGKITDGEAIIIDTQRNSAAAGSGITLPPYTGRTLISNNVIFNNGSSAVEVFESDHVDVINNSTFNNDLSPAEPGRGELNLNSVDDLYAFNNIFYSATGQSPIVQSKACANCTVDYNLDYNGSNVLLNPEGTHELKADPKYINPSATDPSQVDLHVSSASPAVDSGVSAIIPTVTAPSVDAAGTKRPVGKTIDRGAYEQ